MALYIVIGIEFKKKLHISIIYIFLKSNDDFRLSHTTIEKAFG